MSYAYDTGIVRELQPPLKLDTLPILPAMAVNTPTIANNYPRLVSEIIHRIQQLRNNSVIRMMVYNHLRQNDYNNTDMVDLIEYVVTMLDNHVMGSGNTNIENVIATQLANFINEFTIGLFITLPGSERPLPEDIVKNAKADLNYWQQNANYYFNLKNKAALNRAPISNNAITGNNNMLVGNSMVGNNNAGYMYPGQANNYAQPVAVTAQPAANNYNAYNNNMPSPVNQLNLAGVQYRNGMPYLPNPATQPPTFVNGSFGNPQYGQNQPALMGNNYYGNANQNNNNQNVGYDTMVNVDLGGRLAQVSMQFATMNNLRIVGMANQPVVQQATMFNSPAIGNNMAMSSNNSFINNNYQANNVVTGSTGAQSNQLHSNQLEEINRMRQLRAQREQNNLYQPQEENMGTLGDLRGARVNTGSSIGYGLEQVQEQRNQLINQVRKNNPGIHLHMDMESVLVRDDDEDDAETVLSQYCSDITDQNGVSIMNQLNNNNTEVIANALRQAKADIMAGKNIMLDSSETGKYLGTNAGNDVYGYNQLHVAKELNTGGVYPGMVDSDMFFSVIASHPTSEREAWCLERTVVRDWYDESVDPDFLAQWKPNPHQRKWINYDASKYMCELLEVAEGSRIQILAKRFANMNRDDHELNGKINDWVNKHTHVASGKPTHSVPLAVSEEVILSRDSAEVLLDRTIEDAEKVAEEQELVKSYHEEKLTLCTGGLNGLTQEIIMGTSEKEADGKIEENTKACFIRGVATTVLRSRNNNYRIINRLNKVEDLEGMKQVLFDSASDTENHIYKAVCNRLVRTANDVLSHTSNLCIDYVSDIYDLKDAMSDKEYSRFIIGFMRKLKTFLLHSTNPNYIPALKEYNNLDLDTELELERIQTLPRTLLCEKVYVAMLTDDTLFVPNEQGNYYVRQETNPALYAVCQTLHKNREDDDNRLIVLTYSGEAYQLQKDLKTPEGTYTLRHVLD